MVAGSYRKTVNLNSTLTMVLDINKINEILKQPRNKAVISKAVLLEQRLKFHTETNLASSDINQPTQVFLDWVQGLLPKDKYNTFLQLFSFPLPTAAIVEDVYRELERVFYSRNSNASYQFTDSSIADDWRTYRTSTLGQPMIWKTDGWQNMKTAINSILIVDLPQKQVTEKPNPYFYWMDIRNVVDFDSPDGSSLNWLIIKQPNDKIAVFDSSSYRIFTVKSDSIVKLDSEAKHSIGYCPARFFWTSFAIESNKAVKKNTIVKQLSNLDWLLFFTISKRHLDLYAPYPIYSAYEADCSFANNETGSYCDGGFLRNAEGNYAISRSGALDRCPVCAEKRIAGPGSFLEIPVPNDGSPDLRNPVQITTVDIDSLTYNKDECVRLKNEIIVSCVGSNGLVSEKEAINETQVAANFENKTSVLNNLKVNFENAQKFIEDTICKLRYGSDFISSSISWGSEFYIFTVDELYNKYKIAKDNGASMSELDSLVNQIIETEYKENPMMLHRMQILKQIEPFRHLTITETVALFQQGLASREEIALKLNINALVDRFERENTNIVEFGSKTNLSTKIDTITNKLYEYVKAEITR
jgi:hypothetical protein